MTTHGTPLVTLEQMATLDARFLIALPRALELLAERGIDIKRALKFTGKREKDARALMIAIRALVDGHADTMLEDILETIGVIDLPDAFGSRPDAFRSRRDIKFLSNAGYADEFLRRLENADGPLPSRMVEAKLIVESDDAAVADYLGDDAFVMWRVIPMLLDSGGLSVDCVYLLYVRTRGKNFSVTIWRDKMKPVWCISLFPCGEGFRRLKGVIVLKRS